VLVRVGELQVFREGCESLGFGPIGFILYPIRRLPMRLTLPFIAQGVSFTRKLCRLVERESF
jgi:hypothetical protein